MKEKQNLNNPAEIKLSPFQLDIIEQISAICECDEIAVRDIILIEMDFSGSSFKEACDYAFKAFFNPDEHGFSVSAAREFERSIGWHVEPNGDEEIIFVGGGAK